MKAPCFFYTKKSQFKAYNCTLPDSNKGTVSMLYNPTMCGFPRKVCFLVVHFIKALAKKHFCFVYYPSVWKLSLLTALNYHKCNLPRKHCVLFMQVFKALAKTHILLDFCFTFSLRTYSLNAWNYKFCFMWHHRSWNVLIIPMGVFLASFIHQHYDLG